MLILCLFCAYSVCLTLRVRVERERERSARCLSFVVLVLCVCVASFAWLLLGVCPAWWLAFLSEPLMLKGEVALQRPCDLLQLSLCLFSLFVTGFTPLLAY